MKNRCDCLDPALCWTGCKDTGCGAGLSMVAYHALTRPESNHLKMNRFFFEENGFTSVDLHSLSPLYHERLVDEP